MANGTIEKQGIKRAKVYDTNVTMDSEYHKSITFSLPSDFHKSYGVVIGQAWPINSWAGAVVSILRDRTLDGIGEVTISSGSIQTYGITLYLLYE